MKQWRRKNTTTENRQSKGNSPAFFFSYKTVLAYMNRASSCTSLNDMTDYLVSTTIISISTFAPFGNPETATVARAG